MVGHSGVTPPAGIWIPLAVAVFLVSASGAVGASRPQPNPEVLWRAYPLDQTPTTTAPAPPRRPRPAAPASDPPWLLLVAIGVGASTLGAVALRRLRRPPRAAPAPIVISGRILPPASAPAARNGAVCQVRWSSDGAAFYAVARDAQGVERRLADSRRLDWPGPDPPEQTPEAQAALRLLARDLRGLGWEPLRARGFDFDERRWYARRFRRPA